MAVSIRKQCERSRAKWDAASKAFCDWAIANGYGNIRRNELETVLANVPQGLALLVADRETRKALDTTESEAVSAGHAWRNSHGSVYFYSPAEVRRFASQRRRAL